MPVRTLQGKVISHKMSKTRTILVNRRQKHPKYGKYINLSTKYHAHDEKDVSKEGDEVLIQECRPISKTKSWKILEVLGGNCLLYTSPSPRDMSASRMPSSA